MAAGPVHFAKLEALLRDITDRAERRGIRNLTLMKHLRDILEGTYQMQMMSHRGVPGFAITPAEAEQDLFEIVHLAYLLGSAPIPLRRRQLPKPRIRPAWRRRSSGTSLRSVSPPRCLKGIRLGRAIEQPQRYSRALRVCPTVPQKQGPSPGCSTASWTDERKSNKSWTDERLSKLFAIRFIDSDLISRTRCPHLRSNKQGA
jgi:hypothetical protein